MDPILDPRLAQAEIRIVDHPVSVETGRGENGREEAGLETSDRGEAGRWEAARDQGGREEIAGLEEALSGKHGPGEPELEELDLRTPGVVKCRESEASLVLVRVLPTKPKCAALATAPMALPPCHAGL